MTALREPGTLLVRAPEALWRRVGPVVVARTPQPGAPVWTLSDTGAAVWDAFASPRTVDDVVDTLALAYAVEPDQVAESVAPFARELEACGLLVPAP